MAPSRTAFWTRRSACSTLIALAALMGAPLASAQAWPSRPVTLVVGTPAGGAIDAYARTLAD